MTLPGIAVIPIDGPALPAPAQRWKSIFENPLLTWCLAFVPYLIAIIYSARSLAKGHSPGNLIDFLGAAREMLTGGDIYLGGTGGYVYPPLIAFLYQPLALIPQHDAAFVSLAINAILSAFTLILISRVMVERLIGSRDPLLIARVALLASVCTADKIRGEFYHLETNVFMLLAFTAAMRWVDRRPWLCGLALGFGFNVKYWPIVLIPYLCLRRRWSAVAWSAIFAILFALLPAISLGWHANLHAWTQALGGLLKLFGVSTHIHNPAQLRSAKDAISLSLTSGLARLCGTGASFLLAAFIASLFCLYAAVIYRRNQLPIIFWPPVKDQSLFPGRGLLTVEWIGMLLLTLIFSPFTNSRHLYMLLDVNVAAAVLLLGTRHLVPRLPLLLAALVMAIGITFPPGGMVLFGHSLESWHRIGGPGWSMLAMYTALIWTNVHYQRTAASLKPAAILPPHPISL